MDIMRRYFTLIELLIVIAIIAILAGMLLPALGKVQKTAKVVECLNRCKGVGRVGEMYRADWNDFLGSPGNPTYDIYYRSPQVKSAYYERPPMTSCDTLQRYLFWHYLKIHPQGPASYNEGKPDPVWDRYSMCPTIKKVNPLTGGIYKNDLTGRFGYGYNGHLSGVGLSYARLPKPSRTAFVGESDSTFVRGTTFSRGENIFMNHDDLTASVYFADGHTEKRSGRTVPFASGNAAYNVPSAGYGKFLNSYYWGLRDYYYHDNATASDLD